MQKNFETMNFRSNFEAVRGIGGVLQLVGMDGLFFNQHLNSEIHVVPRSNL